MKIIVAGDSGVGKSDILKTLIINSDIKSSNSTTDLSKTLNNETNMVDMHFYKVNIKGKLYNVSIYYIFKNIKD